MTGLLEDADLIAPETLDRSRSEPPAVPPPADRSPTIPCTPAAALLQRASDEIQDLLTALGREGRP